MKQYSKSGKYWEVVRLFKEMKFVNCKADIVCYSTVIDSLVRFNRPKEAKVIFGEMVVLGLHFDLACYTILVKLYSCCLREFDLAYEVMRVMARNGISPDLITYSTLITGMCWDLRIDEALDVLDWMIEVDCIPNAYTFTPIVQAYCYVGKIKEAKKLLATMEKIGCLPNVVTYNILIEALCKDRKFDEVEKVFNESRMKSWEPDEISYSIYMDGLCKIGLHQKAFQLVDVMIGKGLKPNEVTLNILLNSLCCGSNILDAKYLLEKSSGLSWNVANYNTVMSRLCDFGLWLDVLKLFTNMLKKGVDANVRTFSILIDSLCRAGKFHMAKCLLDNNRSLSNVVTYTTLIHHFYLAGKMNDAYLLFSKMEEENIFPNVVTYSIMINCLCKEGKFIEAIKCFHKSLKDGFSPPLAATIIERLIGGGRFSDASYFIKQIGLLGYSLDSCFFRSVIKSYCRMGYWHKVEIYRLCHLLEKMIKLGAV